MDWLARVKPGKFGVWHRARPARTYAGPRRVRKSQRN
jgi:hypothetical protein